LELKLLTTANILDDASNLTPNPFPSGKGNQIEEGVKRNQIVWSSPFPSAAQNPIIGSEETLLVLLPFPLGKGPGVRFSIFM
jgi:hypothetical protein